MTDWVGVQMADVWSCGVMLYIMLSAAYPFGRAEDEKLRPSKKMHAMLQVGCTRPSQIPEYSKATFYACSARSLVLLPGFIVPGHLPALLICTRPFSMLSLLDGSLTWAAGMIACKQ